MRVLLGALLALFGWSVPAKAGILVEATLENVPLRLEMGADFTKVLAEVQGEAMLVDVANETVWRLDGSGRPILAGSLNDGATHRPYRLARWSEGPMVAGHTTSYNVMQLGEAICSEVLTSPWMMAFLEPMQRAIELLQRTERTLRPPQRDGCGRIPFRAFAQNGWPLMAGWKDRPLWQVNAIAFDHYVDPARVVPPVPSATAP